jgi:broad specificity phosphatase PhoE
MFNKPLHVSFYIFRHGDTYQTKNRLPYKDKAISAPIIPEASEYLKKLGNYLKEKNIEYAVSSAFPRCVQSVKIVGKQMGMTFFLDVRLNEYDPPNLPGESEEHFKNRLYSFLSQIQEKKFTSVAICTHGSVISFLKHKLTNTISQFDSLDYPAPGILLTIKNGETTVHDFRK